MSELAVNIFSKTESTYLSFFGFVIFRLQLSSAVSKVLTLSNQYQGAHFESDMELIQKGTFFFRQVSLGGLK